MSEVFFKPAIEKASEDEIDLTFDDVRLIPRYSDTLPKNVDIRSRFSRNVPLGIPIASAAMDKVTEHKLAIALSMEGGIGIIHKGLTPKKQAWEVAKVKRKLNDYIEDPICIHEDEVVKAVKNRIQRRGYEFRRFPVLNGKNKLVGIVTGNDFDLCCDDKKRIKEIMTKDLLMIDHRCSTEEAYKHMVQNKKKSLPVADVNGNVLGLFVFTDVERVINGSGYNVDKKGRLIVGAAIGVYNDAYRRLEKLVEEDVDVVVIDTSHGDSKGVHETLRKVKKLYPNLDVVAGNVCTADAAKSLVDLGADGVKVGVGPGSTCTTRIVTGAGRPQATSIYDCAKAIYGSGVSIIADGGLSKSGDLAIAIASGAECLMLGSMLAGTDESPGDLIFVKGETWKDYRGMGSIGAMKSSASARQRYNQENDLNNLVPQGVEGRVPYKGPLKVIIHQYIGGLRAGMGLVGAKNIQDLIEKGQFKRETNAGLRESHPHDINITREAPNYSPQMRY